MIKSVEEFDYGIVEGKTDSLRWGEDFSLLCTERDQLEYAEKCLEYLDNLPEDVEKRLRKYLVRYFEAYVSYYDEEELAEWGPITEETVMEHIYIGSVIVDEDSRRDRIEFHIEGECDWEPEHGLEITFSEGKILYVGPFEDNPPNSKRLEYAIEHYGFYKVKDDFNMNYADKE